MRKLIIAFRNFAHAPKNVWRKNTTGFFRQTFYYVLILFMSLVSVQKLREMLKHT
jgi:hypothetical protein